MPEGVFCLVGEEWNYGTREPAHVSSSGLDRRGYLGIVGKVPGESRATHLNK